MKKLFNGLFGGMFIVCFPVIAGAAGTYYNGNVYQGAQQRYGAYGSNYYNNAYAGRGADYSSTRQAQANQMAPVSTTNRVIKQTSKTISSGNKQGFYLDAGLSHEFGKWEFDMKNAGSKLHYDNLAWNVIDGELSYYFGNSTPVQIKVGGKYGKQFGESSMIDDDISNDGVITTVWKDGASNLVGYQTTHALSVGSSKNGTQMGFNAGIGLPNFFSVGRLKMTPSIGYRYFKYELTTKKNYGITMDILESTSYHPYYTCVTDGTQWQCDPFVLFYFLDGNFDEIEDANGDIIQKITGRVDLDDDPNIVDLSDILLPVSSIPTGSQYIALDVGGTYYYEQFNTSHKYTTEWKGPYVALDMEYEIDNKNFVTGGIEFGLPIYDSVGNQPYREDWRHPKSVEDTGKFGDAIHIGLNGNWSTAVSDSTYLSFGFTYDYYKVSDATAKTFLNPDWQDYQPLLTAVNNKIVQLDTLKEQQGGVFSDAQSKLYDQLINAQADLESKKAAGWTEEYKKEINSIYKSMGIRVGINVLF